MFNGIKKESERRLLAETFGGTTEQQWDAFAKARDEEGEYAVRIIRNFGIINKTYGTPMKKKPRDKK